ncbi:MAG: fibronectin type III domain-containing protein, partial [gamma proteobacterium symbiont of Clathrolucina costata]
MGKNKSFRLITGLILLFVSIGILLSCMGTTADSAPGKPTKVQAAAGDTEVTITWTAPTDTGTVCRAAGTITGYKIYYSTTGTVTTSDSSVDVADTTTLSHTFDNLTNGTAYYFAVTASNGSGEGDLSAPASATPMAGKQDLANIQLSYPAITMDFGAITGNTASPSWAVSDADVDYNIASRPQGATPDNVTIDTDTGVVTATANAASADSGDYTVKATAKSVSTGYEGTQTATLSLTVNKLAGKPTVSVTPADGKVTLGWNAPDAGYQGAVAATIAGYKIYHSTTRGFNVATGTLTDKSSDPTTSLEVTGLDNGKTYYFRVLAVTDQGEGELSDEASGTPRSGPVDLSILSPGYTDIAMLTGGPTGNTVSPSWKVPNSE